MVYFEDKDNRCYIAAGAFNEEQTKDRDTVRDTLKKLHISYFSPLEDPKTLISEIEAQIFKPKVRDQIFKNDVDSILECTFMVASVTGNDTGTCFECGYAFANSRPVIYYYPYEEVLNLMLSQSAYAVAKSEDELYEILKELKENGFDFSKRKPYTGKVQ